MEAVGRTHPGLGRDTNEDRLLIRELSGDCLLLAVADGVGGHSRGDEAAQIVVDTLERFELSQEAPEDQLIRLVVRAGDDIQAIAARDPSLEGMGSTVTAAVLESDTAFWVNVGDSRLSLLRDDHLIQVTKDQNLAQFLFDEGKISAEDTLTHPLRNFLEQAVGSTDVEPVTGRLGLKSGDLLLLSTDGLHGELTPRALTTLLSSPAVLDDLAESAVQAALESGGRDNITLILAKNLVRGCRGR